MNFQFLSGFIVLFVYNNCLSQNIVASATKMNVLYIDVDNPFTFAVNNKDCKDFQLSSNNGIITCDDSCHCSINPIKIGTTIIYIKDKKGELIDSSVYRTKDLPDPFFNAGYGNHNGYYWKRSKGAYLTDGDFSLGLHFTIKQFDIVKSKNDSMDVIEKIVTNIGPYYSEEALKLINSAKPKDVYYFENIIVIQPNGRERKIAGLAFRID